MALGFVALTGAAATFPAQIYFKANGPGAALRIIAAKLSDMPVSVSDFTGCDTTGSTDSTACIQASHDAQAAGKTVLVPIGTYLLSGTGITISKSLTLQMEKGATLTTAGTSAIVVSGATGVTIQGGTINLQNNSSGTAQFAINPSGTVSDLLVDNVTFTGTGTVPDGTHGIQTAFGNNSGQTLSNIEVRRSTISAVNVGISFNADLGGSLSDVRAIGNHLSNIVGTVSGTGYGLHCAYGTTTVPAKVKFIGNDIDGAQRHSIYMAKCIGGEIAYNQITNHRVGICDGTQRPAIHIQRSRDITASSNTIESPCDGAIDVGTDDVSFPLFSVTLIGNKIRNWKGFPAMAIGSLDPTTSPTSDVIVAENHFVNDLSVSGATGGVAEAIRLYNGFHVTVSTNVFDITNAPSSVQAINIQGLLESGTATYSDDLRFIGNDCIMSGTGTRCFRWESGMCGSTIRVEFIANRMFGTASTFNLAATHTDTNTYVFHNLTDGLDTTKLHALDGNVTLGTATISSLSVSNNVVVGGQVIASSGAATLSLRGTVTDGSLAVANRSGSTNALSTAGAQIHAFYSDNFSTKVSFVDLRGGYNMGTVLQANLGTPPNGTILYCSDCNTATACTAGGTGALASRQNGAWKCL